MKKIICYAMMAIMVVIAACSKKSVVKQEPLTFYKSFFDSKNSLATAD